jgi:hypothetical protein
MDSYTLMLVLGAAGLATMAIGGLGRHGHGGRASHGHGHAHAHTTAHGHGAARGTAALKSSASSRIAQLVSPRVIFSFLLGVGLTGMLLRSVIGGAGLFTLSLAGGVLFERLVVTPLFNFAFRFASRPARTLESAVMDEATVVTSFDSSGRGIVQVELDGQLVQVLGSLTPGDRARGMRPIAGTRVRIEQVDSARNACTVSLR